MSPYETRRTWCTRCKHETEHQLFFERGVSDTKYSNASVAQCLSCGKKVNLTKS